jgi:antirestriction protein ArdC
LTHGGDRAFYSPGTDSITLPRPEAFNDEASYYGTALHEHAHWTGSEHRLNRTFGKRFGDSAYAFEELVAELAAAFLTADLGIPGKLQHPEYLAHWATVLGNDKQALWTAASAATKAADYLHQQGAPVASKAA